MIFLNGHRTGNGLPSYKSEKELSFWSSQVQAGGRLKASKSHGVLRAVMQRVVCCFYFGTLKRNNQAAKKQFLNTFHLDVS